MVRRGLLRIFPIRADSRSDFEPSAGLRGAASFFNFAVLEISFYIVAEKVCHNARENNLAGYFRVNLAVKTIEN